MKDLIAGRNILLFIVTFVGINALFEMVVTTIMTTAVGPALSKARLLPEANKSAAEKKDQ